MEEVRRLPFTQYNQHQKFWSDVVFSCLLICAELFVVVFVNLFCWLTCARSSTIIVEFCCAEYLVLSGNELKSNRLANDPLANPLLCLWMPEATNCDKQRPIAEFVKSNSAAAYRFARHCCVKLDFVILIIILSDAYALLINSFTF